jgi:hypothetical protein
VVISNLEHLNHSNTKSEIQAVVTQVIQILNNEHRSQLLPANTHLLPFESTLLTVARPGSEIFLLRLELIRFED